MIKEMYDNKVQINCTDTDKNSEAEIGDYKKGVGFNAYIANTKISLRWNGKVYVGNYAGLEFTSSGPRSYGVKT